MINKYNLVQILFLTAALTLNIFDAGAHETAVAKKVVSPSHSAKMYRSTFPENTPLRGVASLSDEETVAVTYNFVYDKESVAKPIFQQFVFPVDGSFPYTAFPNEDKCTFYVKKGGVYDLCAIFSSTETGSYLVAKDNVSINNDMTIDFNIEDATNHIENVPLLPDGNAMVFGAYDEDTGEVVAPGNIQYGNLEVQFIHRAYGPFMACQSLIAESGPMCSGDCWISSSVSFSSEYSILAFRQDSEGGSPVIVSIKPDGNMSQTVSNNVNDFVEYNAQFADAIANEYNDPAVETGTDVSIACKGMLDPLINTYGVSYITLDLIGSPYRYEVCLDKYLERQPASMFFPGKVMAYRNWNDTYGIISPGIVRTQSGESMFFANQIMNCVCTLDMTSSYWMKDNPTKLWTDNNSVFSCLWDDSYVIGNSCPLFLPAYKPGRFFSYNYNGRIGELRSIDLLSSQLEIKADGETIVDSYAALADKQLDMSAIDGMAIDVRVVNENLMIDNLYPAYGEANLHIAGGDAYKGFPSVTMLQFRDGTDKVTERFDSRENAAMILSAATFYCETNYYTPSKLEDLKVEYSPYGRGEYKELKAAVDEEVGLISTYGWLWRANLADMDADSPQGWYDVRLTATAPGGSYMTQVISPAFLIGDPAKLDIVDLNREDGVVVCGRDIVAPDGSEVYTVGGRRSGLSNLASGVYVVRTPDGRATKVVIR